MESLIYASCVYFVIVATIFFTNRNTMLGILKIGKEQGQSPESPPPPSIAFLIIKKNSCYYDDLNATGIYGTSGIWPVLIHYCIGVFQYWVILHDR